MNTQFNVVNKWYLFAYEIRIVSGDLAIVNNLDIGRYLDVNGLIDVKSGSLVLSKTNSSQLNMQKRGIK